MVEGREGQHRPDRLELGEGQAPAGTGRAAHGNLFAGLGAEMFDAQADAVDARSASTSESISGLPPSRAASKASRSRRPASDRPRGGGFRSAAPG